MKPLLACLLLITNFIAEVSIIPLPVPVDETSTRLLLKLGDFVYLPHSSSKDLYLSTLSKAAGFPFSPAPADVSCPIQFLGPDSLPAEFEKPSNEGYVLRILEKTAIIHAATQAGHLNGLQSLAQLIASATRSDDSLSLPSLTIIDSPRFAWRGFMLDESRSFTGIEGLKRLLDGMGRYKLNVLHWHLTDSPGWRIEIKKYPKLTEIGGRGNEHDQRPNAPAEFYTQDQIRELVAYAKERNITIVPEIDMPGHADAAVRAYPEHDGGGYLKKDSTTKWPRFTFNPAKAQTLTFLDDILTEVASLFPDAGIIHLGGDEVHFGWHKWPKLPEVQSLMKKENLKDLAAVETWFIQRMAGKINQLGFETGGWDEIASRDLPKDKTLVFWWRHDKPQILSKALADGYPVILCPRRPCYFDFLQHPSHKNGRNWKGINILSDVYNFPADLKLSPVQEKQVRGIQACLWTETTITQARRDFLTWPRLIALAEAAWTPSNRKDFSSFEKRLPAEFKWLEGHGIGYYDPFRNSTEVTDSDAALEYLDNPE